MTHNTGGGRGVGRNNKRRTIHNGTDLGIGAAIYERMSNDARESKARMFGERRKPVTLPRLKFLEKAED